jgi:hypothetical protein
MSIAVESSLSSGNGTIVFMIRLCKYAGDNASVGVLLVWETSKEKWC